MSTIILRMRLREPDENGSIDLDPKGVKFPTLNHAGKYISALEGPSMPSAKITIDYVASDAELANN